MSNIPTDPKKIRERIRRYERALRNEKKKFGAYDDSAGKRHFLGPLYLLMGDTEGALKSFRWFEQEFPDDIGEPSQYLSWTLTLYRSGEVKAARDKLLQTMFGNLYLIPHLLGEDQPELDIWYGAFEHKEYIDYVPPEFLELWDEEALQWAKDVYDDPETVRLRERYIEIERQLKGEPRGSKRSSLVEEAFRMRRIELQ